MEKGSWSKLHQCLRGNGLRLGSATIAIVVATIFLLKPYPEDTTIADPPSRP